LAQSLVAARRTVEDDWPAHSLHGYFILEGDLSVPVVYFVDRLRDGRSYATRRVTGIQHGEAIFNMSASFHRPEEGLAHQMEMPSVPPPDAFRTELENIREHADEIPESVRGVMTQERPLDIRPVDAVDPFDPKPGLPRQMYWIRTIGRLGDQPLQHQAIMAYASDFGLLGAALRPHGVTYRDPSVLVASLDHAIWYHRPFRIDEWLLYVVDSPSSGHGRGFSRGTFFTQDGHLVASVAQEGVVRQRRK
ncbi:MAG: acyl-CoA thioesterase II, partial [Longimicrobiales bacterium]